LSTIFKAPEMKVDKLEFILFKKYLAEHCGMILADNKAYLVEIRLAALVKDYGFKSFNELYQNAVKAFDNELRDKIIDAMTTHETLWFRDQGVYDFLNLEILPAFSQALRLGKKETINIWSAACSTGQEPYSVAITIHEYADRHPLLNIKKFNVIATDVSNTVLDEARNGIYNNLAMKRGLPPLLRDKYFKQYGNQWQITDRIKAMVNFQQQNLKDRFQTLKMQDLILCRNVLIYLSDNLKTDILNRMAGTLSKDGYLILGGTESIINYSAGYDLIDSPQGLFYKLKQGCKILTS
jgi:chemotaxis protein methyltransferase CheR